MPSATTKGYRYPLATDPVTQGSVAIQNLATDVDSKSGAHCSGTHSVTILNGAYSGNLAVTFPVGRFSAPPNVAAVCAASSAAFIANTGLPTATGVTLGVFTRTGSPVGANTSLWVGWVAHQN